MSKESLLYDFARLVRNTDDLAMPAWGVRAVHLLAALKAMDEEAYRVEVATKRPTMNPQEMAGDQMVKEHEPVAPPPPGDLSEFMSKPIVGKHTPAPWIPSGDQIISERTGTVVIEGADWHVDDSERAMACVNFCEGVAGLRPGGLAEIQARLWYYDNAQNSWVDRSFMLQTVLCWMTELNLQEWGPNVAQALAQFAATNQVRLCREPKWKHLIFPPFLRGPLDGEEPLPVAPGVDKKVVAEAAVAAHHRESHSFLYSGKELITHGPEFSSMSNQEIHEDAVKE